MKLLGLSCGRKNGNGELLLKEALMAAEETADLRGEILRLQDFEIRPCTGCESCTLSMMRGGDGLCRVHQGKDDMGFLKSRLDEADGMIIAAPVYCLTAPAQLKMMHERFLGLGPQFLMSVFERASRTPKIGATITGSTCTPANASTVSVAVAASDTREITRSMKDRPKRGSSLALICEPAISPHEHSPKISANCQGARPKPRMNTGDDPAR